VVSFTPRPLYSQGIPWYPLDRKLCGPQSRSTTTTTTTTTTTIIIIIIIIIIIMKL
jgi:hypothetical protein